MPITREQISRKLDFDENPAPTMRATRGGIDNIDSRKKQGKVKANQTSDSNKPQLRVRTTKPNSPDRYDLTKMSSSEVQHLLGNGPDPETSSVKKSLAESKKKETALRINVVSTVNNTVADLNNINDDDDSKMDDTVPLSESEMIQESTDDDNGRQKEDDGSKEGTDSAASPNHGSVPVPAPNHSPVAASTVGSTMERCDKITQTDSVLIFCGCERCQALFSGFNNLVLAAANHDCGTIFKTKDSSGIVFNNDSMEFSGNRNGDTKVPLFVGSSIMISLTDKTLLKNLDDETPKDYVNFIMDAIYDPTEMAMMTANGRTKGSTKMDKKIKINLHAYIQHKFKGEKITRKLLNKFINAKCYCERRKLWNKQKALGDSEDIAVRKPLKKFTRDPSKPRKVANPGNKNKEKKKASRHRKESKGVSQQGNQRHHRNSPKKNITPSKFNRKQFLPATYSSPAFSPIKKNMPKKKDVLKSMREEGDRPVTGGKRPRPISEILGGDKLGSLSASSTPHSSAKKLKRDEAGTREYGLDVRGKKNEKKESSHRDKEMSHRKESSHRDKELTHREKESSHRDKESSHRQKESSHRKYPKEKEDEEYEEDEEYYDDLGTPISIGSSSDDDDEDEEEEEDDDDDEEDNGELSDIQTD